MTFAPRHLPVRNPRPDAAAFIQAMRGQFVPRRPPLVEYLIDEKVLRTVVTDLLDRPWAPFGPDREAQRAYLDNMIAFWAGMGYDFVRFELGLPFPKNSLQAADPTSNAGRRAWADEHRGAIRHREDGERYRWPRVEEFDFFPFEYLSQNLPDGMGFIASHAGGVFEHLSWILSLEGLSLALNDDPALVAAVAEKIGNLILQFTEQLVNLPRLVALFPGDDMGFKTGLLVSPVVLRTLVLPWHQKMAALAHRRGIPYFLHSCGNLTAILPDLVDAVGIDGKHSFEDAIQKAEDFQARWGDRLAVLGGVDLHLLAQGDEEDVRRRTRRLMEACGPRGRFAVGSGNSIPSYIPVRNYLAMIDEGLGAD